MKKRYNDVILYKIVRPIVTFLFKLLYRPKIEGKENINTERIYGEDRYKTSIKVANKINELNFSFDEVNNLKNL